MTTRRRKTALDPETEVCLAGPILPHGIVISVRVPFSMMAVACKRLLNEARAIERELGELPVPGPEVVPGGSPVNGDDIYDITARPRRRKAGFREPGT